MIEITEFAPQTVEMKVKGPIGPKDLERLEAALDLYQPDEGAVSAVIDVSEASPEVTNDLGHDPTRIERLMSQFDKFARIAVVTPGRARVGVLRAVGALLPSGALKRFDPASLGQARAFAAHLSRPEATPAE